MALARREFTVVDERGDIVTAAQVEVRREVAGTPLASIYSDRDGTTPLANPFSVDPTTAVAAFHVVGGAYRIRAYVTAAGFERVERYVGIGTGAETDAALIPTSIATAWLFDDPTADADPGSGLFRLNHATPASATEIYLDNENAGGNSVTAWLDSLDDGGESAARGQLTICDPDQPTEVFHIYQVSGSVVDGTGYRKLTVTHVAGAGSFTAGTDYSVTFAAQGVDSAGTVATNLAAHIADTTAAHAASAVSYSAGGNIAATTVQGAIEELDSEKQAAATAIAQGKHTIWVPASAMVSRTTNGAASVTTELATNDVMLATKDFDQTTSEGVQFSIAMPKGWDEGTVTFVPYWTAAAGSATQTVIWAMAGLARSDDDALDTAFGTAQSSSDALIAANDLHVGPESSAITIGGTPAESDLVIFQVTRDVSDTLAADAKLIGVKVLYTINASTDA